MHLEATPALRGWLQRFDRLLWSISADAPPPEVATQVLGIAGTARDSKDAALRCVAAAAAAEAAQQTAEAAAEHAKQAQHATAATVRELLLAKRAEVEAEQLIRQRVCSLLWYFPVMSCELQKQSRIGQAKDKGPWSQISGSVCATGGFLLNTMPHRTLCPASSASL